MINLLKGDCLEVMKTIEDNSIDAIITDPPYGTTACKWDSVIDFDLMWEQLNRIIKPNGAIVLFGSEPFSSLLRVSNLEMFKYDWIWKKSSTPNFAQAPYRALTKHEVISVFSFGGTANNAKNRMKYYPQGLKACSVKQGGMKKDSSEHRQRLTDQKPFEQKLTNYPISIIDFNNRGKTVHPTQKPILLMEYLIKTYTNENETVLDFTMGSGSTMVACQNTNRNGIGIEQDEAYFKIAEQRIKENEYKLF